MRGQTNNQGSEKNSSELIKAYLTLLSRLPGEYFSDFVIKQLFYESSAIRQKAVATAHSAGISRAAAHLYSLFQQVPSADEKGRILQVFADLSFEITIRWFEP